MLDAHCANIPIIREKAHKKWISQHLQLLQLHLGGGRGTGFIRDWHSSLDDEERRRRDRRIPRVALVEPKKSAWRRILASGNNQILITKTELDFSVFLLHADFFGSINATLGMRLSLLLLSSSSKLK